MDWNVRKHTIMNEVKNLIYPPASVETSPLEATTSTQAPTTLSAQSPDILCMEELDNYWSFFKPEFEKLGYDSVYAKRPSIHRGLRTGKAKEDGCGIFFKKDKFELIREKSINFHDIHDRIALTVLLRHRHGKRRHLLVCNTHLYWDARCITTQLGELAELHAAVTSLVGDCHKYGILNLPIVVCGDFNNGPGSEVYSYMAQRFLRESDMEMRSAYDCYSLQDGSAPHVPKPLHEAIAAGVYEPPHTTVTHRRRWTIDYIWYSTTELTPLHVLEIPSEDYLRVEDGPEGWIENYNQEVSQQRKARGVLASGKRHTGIPNSKHGSDHLPIAAVFAFKG
eukprot:Colp12_sorted_trinity150504_noHs@25422